jgi:hypothetical protein
MERELKKDSLFTIIGNDRVHPESTGHFIMFCEIISKLEAPEVVSKIAIDANQDEQEIRVQNLRLQNAQFSESLISFQTCEMSLPFPIGGSLQEAVSFTSFEELYNQQLFQAEGLPNKNYDLYIDKQHIGTFDAYDFKNGIDLSFIQKHTAIQTGARNKAFVCCLSTNTIPASGSCLYTAQLS